MCSVVKFDVDPLRWRPLMVMMMMRRRKNMNMMMTISIDDDGEAAGKHGV